MGKVFRTGQDRAVHMEAVEQGMRMSQVDFPHSTADSSWPTSLWDGATYK